MLSATTVIVIEIIRKGDDYTRPTQPSGRSATLRERAKRHLCSFISVSTTSCVYFINIQLSSNICSSIQVPSTT
uniref:Uncharacterized protein n=1 Tax=Hyaloperonospora arabidopsidis (strain Emoy2) TaxID=559515 RepID=M4B311_HYAAE